MAETLSINLAKLRQKNIEREINYHMEKIQKRKKEEVQEESDRKQFDLIRDEIKELKIILFSNKLCYLQKKLTDYKKMVTQPVPTGFSEDVIIKKQQALISEFEDLEKLKPF